jgi:hypothetical protein
LQEGQVAHRQSLRVHALRSTVVCSLDITGVGLQAPAFH